MRKYAWLKKGGVLDEVRRLRKLKGLTQVELAELAGVSAYTITEIETGHREPRASTLRKLAGALDADVGDFFPKARRSSPEAPESHAGEERNSENVWKEEYLARVTDMLVKWEDELEEKLALAESEPVRFFDWLKEVREFGRPLMGGVVSGYIATSSYRLEPVVNSAKFLGPWNDLWLRIEERGDQVITWSADDDKHFRELCEEARIG